MILNLGSLAFNANLKTGGGTPAWGTELGQGEGYKFAFEDMSDFFTGMVYKSISDIENVTCPLGKGGNQREDYDFVIASIFDKVYVNEKRVNDARFLLLVVKKLKGDHHVGRRTIKYNPRMTYNSQYVNEDCYKKMIDTLGWGDVPSWFIHEMLIRNQDELHFYAYQLGDQPIEYRTNDERKNAFLSKLPKDGNRPFFAERTNMTYQQIFYGTPGSGKSHKVKDEMTKAYPNEKEREEFVFRTTFHPDSDYASFVGCYKPKMEGEKIKYEFTPQAFTNAYVKAWQEFKKESGKDVYLIIEEINRGNCAQIFGDLFQLLDRKDGVSEYPINADADLRQYLEREDVLGKDSEGIAEGKLKLPANLYIWATMNTSDQSLFPMDSAFKRRWTWKCVPIDYKNVESENFTIKIGGGYNWHDFLKVVNNRIKDTTNSEDKQMGNFFIKGDVDERQFVDKVMFYLWNDVCKEEYHTTKNFFRYFTDDTKSETVEFAFNDLFDESRNAEKLLERFMEYILSNPKE